MIGDERSEVSQSLCSVFSQNNGEDPGGTAPSWSRCLILELPRPWASEIRETKHFPDLVLKTLNEEESNGNSVKLHCVAPDTEYSIQGKSRVMLFSRPEFPSHKFSEFLKEDYLLPTEMVEELVNALLSSREKLSKFANFIQDTSGVREILVCTHAKYDRCCGKFGYSAFEVLRNEYASGKNNSLRIWQASHLGGHRFAPNIIDLPQGLNWARMGHEELDILVNRNTPPSQIKTNYRGRLGLNTPFEQVVERELLVSHGWGWTDMDVAGEVVNVSEDNRLAEVMIEYSGNDGAISGAYKASVTQIPGAPRVSCPSGDPDGESEQFVVDDLTKITP